jgi:hypothetical protein
MTPPGPFETTPLTPAEEQAFRRWIAVNQIADLDHPDSHYDYRGYWKSTGGAPVEPGMFVSHDAGQQLPRRAHFTDVFKEHGHPTFSQESQYSRGPFDGGMWVGPQADTFLAQPPMAVSHDGRDAGVQPLSGSLAALRRKTR